ncbi:MAG: hypothetical protein H6R26_287 [Proteobacteria bacterium]|nr:hypothetical protein [Pseudomonadota bacterium]
MKSSLSLCILTAAVLLPGCAQFHPSSETSRQIIDSLTHSDRHPSSWRLGLAWIPGEHGGAALRSASIEHVVRKKHLLPFIAAHAQPAEIASVALPIAGDEATERAWRKFCRHQLDMTEWDRQIVRDTPIPDWLIGQCYSGSLLK